MLTIRKWALAVFLAASASASASTITLNFSGLSNETTAAPGPGIYSIDSGSSFDALSGSITIDTDDFQGGGTSTYAYYHADAGAVTITITDAGGTETFYPNSAGIDLCTNCTIQWSLFANLNPGQFGYGAVEFDVFSPTLTVDPLNSIMFSPLYDAPASGGYFDGQINEGHYSLGFDWNSYSLATAPEPSTFLICGMALLFFLGRKRIRSR
jgi:hypothetical protein